MWFKLTVKQERTEEVGEMIIPEILLSTSLISLALFIWTFINQWNSSSETCEITLQQSEGRILIISHITISYISVCWYSCHIWHDRILSGRIDFDNELRIKVKSTPDCNVIARSNFFYSEPRPSLYASGLSNGAEPSWTLNCIESKIFSSNSKPAPAPPDSSPLTSLSVTQVVSALTAPER